MSSSDWETAPRFLQSRKRLAEKGEPCHYCKRPMVALNSFSYKENPELACTIEHVLPRSKGGRDDVNNIVFACSRCNQLRGSVPYEVFREFARSILQSYPNTNVIQLRKVLQLYLYDLVELLANKPKLLRDAARLTLFQFDQWKK